MSTALARVRLADSVNAADVEEAIRLMQASKDSLRPELKRMERYLLFIVFPYTLF